MGRTPCCEKVGLKKGRWTDEEDKKLIEYIQANGEGSWRSLPKNAGLLRCGKSCRLRWINYLRADLKRGNITEEEENTIVKLHASIGNRWSVIASHLPGRTDNEIKNYWNSHLSRKIYRFYKCGTEPKPPSKNAVKMTSPNKQRAGKVNSSVAKKYNKNSALNVKLSTTEAAANDAQNPEAITINPMIGVFNQQEEESRGVAIDNDSSKVSDRLCPAGCEEDKENEVLGPNSYEELEQHMAELRYILESGVEDSRGNLRLDNMETENAFMGIEEMTVHDHESMENISSDGSLSLSDSSREVGHAMNSCFQEDEWFDWGLEAGPVGGLTLPWDEGEDMLIWLWDSGIH